MPSQVDVCNSALGFIGQPVISALTDGSKAANDCAREFPILLRSTLRDHKWNFAFSRLSLAADAETPVSGFTRQFTTPADCLRVWEVGDGSYEWRVELGPDGLIRKILTDAPSPIIIQYVRYVDDPNVWQGGFTTAFISLFASRLLGSIAHDFKGAATLYRQAVVELWEAKAVNGQEGSPEVITSTALTTDVRVA